MDSAAIRIAMTEAGLVNPRVIPHLLRGGNKAFDLFCGPETERRTERIITGKHSVADKKLVATAIEALKG